MPKKYPKDRRSYVGAANELRVCTDLLHKGWHVFRAEAPNGPFDLVAMHKDGRLYRVEVRTGQRLKNGQFSVGRHGTYDILAIVVGTEITYEPNFGLGSDLFD